MLTVEHLGAIAQRGMETTFERVPHARAFHDGSWTEQRYYVRYLIEAAKRVPLMNASDAYALYRHGMRDPVLGSQFARYLAEEWGHERMVEPDLHAFGVTREDVDRTPVLFATDRLMGFLHVAIDRDGLIAPAVWNWFVEWYSDQYNATIARKAAATFGAEKVRGLRAHLAFDQGHQHGDVVFQIARKAIEVFGTDAVALTYLERLMSFVAEYFDELARVTINSTRKEDDMFR